MGDKLSLFQNGTNCRLFKTGRIDAWDEVLLFRIWDELSLLTIGTNCRLFKTGRIDTWDELSLFEIWDELSLRTNRRFLKFGTNCRLGRIVA